MTAASQALQWALGGAFGLLGLLTVVDWLRHRDHSRRYLAASIGLIGAVAVISTFANGASQSAALIDATLVLFALSGWAFLLFRDTLVPLPRAVRIASGLLVVGDSVLLIVAYAPGSLSATKVTPLQTVAGLTLVAVWAACVCEPIYRIWRLSHRLPRVQRARARSLVTGYAGIVLILVMGVVSGFLPAADAIYRVAATPVAVLLLPLFYLAFAPPRWIRRLWRAEEERAFRLALNDLLLFSPDRFTLAERAVEWATRLLGASTAVLASDDGKITVTRGIPPEAAGELVSRDEATDGRTRSTSTVVQARLESQFSKGVLAVRAGPLTPLFGAEEVARLQDYASSVTTALDRVLLVERLRRTGELLDLAYNPIITWDANTGRIRYWNRAAQAMYGWSSEEAVGQEPSALLHSALPVPRDELVRLMRDRGGWEAEISQVTKDGRDVVVSARWALQLDAEGNPDVVLEINRDVTREKHAAEELRRARDEAQRASAAKSEYLSRMSHELRTPLTAILGYSDLLELRDPRGDQLEAVSAIQEASSHLLSLVNDVLDIARIESGRETLAPEPVALGAVVEECMRLVRPAARDRGISVKRELDGTSDAVVQADRQRLVQALLNLMSNAVKYAGRGASVTVRAESTQDSRVRLSVADTGPGLTAEMQRRLFQPFERLGAERTGTPGTGLGLALTKKLVEAMGGEIDVSSEEGKGSTFSITLQRSALEAVPERIREPVRREESVVESPEHTVLYVEDNLATVELMEDVFAMRPGIRMINALQGSMALELAREHRPDLVVLDLHLPDIPGDQVLKQLQQDPQTAHIPVVMFSADATERQIRRLLDLGARSYIVKPAKVAEFLTLLDEVLAPSSTAAV